MSQLDSRPLLLVISGPSGSGKGTALERIARSGYASRVPTYTTRSPRLSETDGVEYRFVDQETFLALYEKGEIFEYTRTYAADFYGSPHRLLGTDEPQPLAVELDPMGFVRLRAASARRVVGIFITTTSEKELHRRLLVRGQGAELTGRMKVRVDQLTWAWSYDYVLLNAEREQFLLDLDAVVRAEVLRTAGARLMLAMRRETDPTISDLPSSGDGSRTPA